jgi:NADH oxidase (H2O2-forming)
VKIVSTLKGKIIGCQIIAESGLPRRIDTMSWLFPEVLTCFTWGYGILLCASTFPVIDPIVLAADDACRKLKRRNELQEKLDL